MVTEDAERTMTTFLGASETLSFKEIDQKLSKFGLVYVEGYLLTSESTSVTRWAVEFAKNTESRLR